LKGEGFAFVPIQPVTHGLGSRRPEAEASGIASTPEPEAGRILYQFDN